MNDIFESTPIQKWIDVIFNANRNLVSSELERLLGLVAEYELLKQQLEINDSSVDDEKNSLAIESMSNILSLNE